MTNNPKAPLAPIIEVLCGYVRLNGPPKEVADSIRLDVQAALDVATQTRPGRPVLDLQDANLAGASLNSADLSDSRIRNASFSGAVLVGANFSQAKGVRCLFQSCQLKNARFVKADLVQAEFNKAELEGTDFSGAFLEKADFTAAKFDGFTKFDGGDLSQTKFFDPKSHEENRMEDQRGLTPESVMTGKFWESATFSSEFRLRMSEPSTIERSQPPEFDDKTEGWTSASASVVPPVEPDAELVPGD